MECIKHLECDLYQKMRRAQGMRNLVFDIQEIIDKPTDLDVWVVYQSEKELKNAHSLHKMLWEISFDP